jgi:hypothetical protein
MEGGIEEVRAASAGLVQLRFQRVAPPQQFLHPRHNSLLFGSQVHDLFCCGTDPVKNPPQFVIVPHLG